MEEADLVAAARQREALERAAATAVTAQETAVKEGVASTAANVTAFMDLHALLRPARTSDHESLTFAPLVLPLALQDEVLATDILRVARMYEDLSSGGEVAHGVLAVLAAGPSGTNKEGK